MAASWPGLRWSSIPWRGTPSGGGGARGAGGVAGGVGRAGGRTIEPSYFLPKALWLARHEPHRYDAARHLLSCPGLLLLRLTGRAVTVLHTQAFRHYYWRDDVLDALGLDRARLPP